MVNCQGFRWKMKFGTRCRRCPMIFSPQNMQKDQAGALAFRVKSTAPVSPTIIWVVVSKVFYFHPENFGRFPFLTYIFQMG